MNSFAYYDNLPFDYDGSHNINDIALRTKKLVSNSNDYNEFIHKFYNHTKLLTFKLPMIKTDRNINKKNIESSEFFNKNNSSALDKINDINYDRNDNHSGNTTLKYLNVEKIKNLKKFKLNFRSDSIFTELNGLSAKDYKFENTSLKFNNNMFITNDNYTKLKIINSNINIFGCNKNKNISEIQQLSGLYFNFEETGLVYDHTDIFEKKETYKNFINDNLLYGEENSNRTSILEKTFNQGNNKEITFNLHSIKIKFTNLNTDINNYFTCELPFELITTFYNFSLDNFKLLLISSIKFNTNYDEAIIDDNDLFSTAKILNQNLKSNQTDLPDYFKKGIENVYRFNWITSNQKFQVEIKLPFLEIFIHKAKRKFEKFLDTELLFYLIKNKFVNWDFYCANYLTSSIDFRNYLNRLFSKAQFTHIKHKSMPLMKIKLKKKLKIKQNDSSTCIEENTKKNHDDNPIVNNDHIEPPAKKEIKISPQIFVNEIKIREYSDQDHHLSFVVTSEKLKQEGDDANNIKEHIVYIYQLTSFSVNISNSFGNNNTINLNLKQMRILCYLSKYGKIENLLRKLVLLDKRKKSYLDLSFFEKYDAKDFNFLDYIFYPAKLKETDSNSNKCLDYKMDVKWPKLTRTSIISNNQSSNSTDNIIINDTTNLHYEEVSLDKNSLNKICVKDINLMIELIESEISFVKKREHIDLKPIKMAKYKLSTINKVFNNKAKSPKLKSYSSFNSLIAFEFKLEQ